jgi:hypothetical protein
MPVALPAIVGTLIPNLVSTGCLGTDVPKLCSGIGGGLVRWVPIVKVSTVDAGTAGAGSNVPTPVVAPQPLLLTNLLTAMASMGLLGIFVPSFVAGLSNGLSVAFLAMLVKTTHPGVGTGAGVGKYVPPPATPMMISGFASAGIVGDSAVRLATAIGMALTTTFASLVVPVAIVGSASPSPASGTGAGSIV